MDLPTFRKRFPEFRLCGDVYVSANLTAAALEVDDCVYGDKYAEAVGLMAAHKMATSPFGMAAKLVLKDGSTTWGNEAARLRVQVSVGLGRLP